MKTMFKKGLAVFIVMIMLCSLITVAPFSVSATEENNAGFNLLSTLSEPKVSSEKIDLIGSFNNWVKREMTQKSTDVYATTIELEAGSYSFKIVENETWLGCYGIIQDTTLTTSLMGWKFRNYDDNCTLQATGGTYTFEFNINTDYLVILWTPAEIETTVPSSSETTPSSSETEPTEHQWDEGTVTLTPTCDTEGEIVYNCSHCDEKKTAVIEALGHDFSNIFTVDKKATCIQEGRKSRHCLRCDAVTDVTVINKNTTGGHTEVIDQAVMPTCTETGFTQGIHCSLCHSVIIPQTIIPATGHIEGIDKAVAPTCTETGLTEGSHCLVCKIVVIPQTIIPATGHTKIVDKAVEATCTETGLTEGSHCSVCKRVIIPQTIIPATGHIERVDKAVEPTCTEKGLTEGSHCEQCGLIMISQAVIPALGHEYTKGITTPATCLVKGSEPYYCYCGYIYTKELPLLEHKEAEQWTVVKEATCQEQGIKVKSCVECDTVLKSQAIEKSSDHTVVVDKAVAPTCGKSGRTEGKHCAKCNKVLVKQSTVKALGHKNTKKTISYFSKGYKYETKCIDCNTLISKGTVYKKVKVKTPTVKIKAGKKKITVNYKKTKGATGFQIKYKKGKVAVIKTYNSNKNVKKVIKKLKKGTYKVKVRAFVKQNNKNFYGSWTKIKKVKVK